MGFILFIVGLFIGGTILDLILTRWKKNLTEKLKKEKEREVNLNQAARNQRQAARHIRKRNRFVRREAMSSLENVKEIPETENPETEKDFGIDLLNLKRLISEFVRIELGAADDKIENARMLASEKIKIKKELHLQVICYGFAISEYWELIEGIKLAFNDDGIDFKLPTNQKEVDFLLGEIFKDVKYESD